MRRSIAHVSANGYRWQRQPLLACHTHAGSEADAWVHGESWPNDHNRKDLGAEELQLLTGVPVSTWC